MTVHNQRRSNSRSSSSTTNTNSKPQSTTSHSSSSSNSTHKAARSSGTKRDRNNIMLSKESKQQQLQQEIELLQRRVMDEAPASGTVPPRQQVVAFASLPLSQATQRGLLEHKFTTLTAIQNACLPHALAGRDVLGAAQTGSGKTLAFLIPVLEGLFRQRFAPADGPGAVVLSPTRELAIQIFQVLKKVGRHHTVSVGLLIGGSKDFFQEQERIGSCNLIIGTPGRLLQHLEQTVDLDLSALQILVLDEADRILDLGFRPQLMRILEYLPAQRQTLLFSATQTRDVSSLAALSLRQQPEYLGVHDQEVTDTPQSLQQSYVVVPLRHKLNALWSFLKSHLQSKTIVFLSTCAQVRHAHHLLCALRPGVSILALHGKLAQERRTRLYFDYLQRPHAVLLATDICARGLDFPNVDWVVQMDAPEDRDMYIHRVGRTARFRSGGQALLLLTPPEEAKGFVEKVLQQPHSSDRATTKGGGSKKKALPLQKLRINPTKATIVTERAASMVASDATLNTLAKKAFQSYVRCIHLMPNKEVYGSRSSSGLLEVLEDLDGFAESLGLASTPNLRFLKDAAANRTEFRENKNVNKKLQRLKEQIKAEKLAKKLQTMGPSRAAAATVQDHAARGSDSSTSSDSDSEDDLLLVPKPAAPEIANDNDPDDLPDSGLHQVSQSRHPRKIVVDGSTGVKTHIRFNDQGQEEDLVLRANDVESLAALGPLEEATESYVTQVRARLDANKAQDEADEKERIRQKHKKRRLDDRGESRKDGEPLVAVLDVDGEPDAVNDNNNEASSSHSESESNDDDAQSIDSESSSSSSEATATDLKTQEEIALALIRGEV